MHRFVLHNDSIRQATEPCLSPGQVGLMTGWGVFSTIRVSEGVLFAFERHFARMKRDAAKLRVPFPSDPEYLETRLQKLIEANGAQNATLRVNVIRNNGGVFHSPVSREFDVVAFTADLADWGQSVRLGVVQQARHGRNIFAGTKVTSWGFNLTWYEKAHEDGYDEVVLLDENGFVSECTSANIFAVFGNEVVTPPLSSGCLPGITREILLTEIHREPLRISERALTLGDLEAADEVFITSTTRDLLPVSAVEGIRLKQGTTICANLGAQFRRFISDYVAQKMSPEPQP